MKQNNSPELSGNLFNQMYNKNCQTNPKNHCLWTEPLARRCGFPILHHIPSLLLRGSRMWWQFLWWRSIGPFSSSPTILHQRFFTDFCSKAWALEIYVQRLLIKHGYPRSIHGYPWMLSSRHLLVNLGKSRAWGLRGSGGPFSIQNFTSIHSEPGKNDESDAQERAKQKWREWRPWEGNKKCREWRPGEGAKKIVRVLFRGWGGVTTNRCQRVQTKNGDRHRMTPVPSG